MEKYKKIHCLDCNKHNKHREKLSAVMDGCRVCDECSRMNGVYTLVKPEDKTFLQYSEDVKWVNYNESGSYKSTKDDIETGCSLLMSPFNDHYTWLTTIIKEVIEEDEFHIQFETENSLYILYKPIKLDRSIL